MLVISQIALAVVLLGAAALLVGSVMRMSSEPLGFDPNRLFTTRVTLPAERYADDSRVSRFSPTLVERVAQLPGVSGAAMSFDQVFGGEPGQLVEIEGREVSAGQRAPEYGVSADFFRVYGIPVVQGRVFGSDDRAQSEAVAVVNATLSRKYVGRASPIGSRIRLGEPGKQGPWLTIAGVVGDVKSDSLYREMSWSEAGPIVFRPLDQSPRRGLALAFRLPRGDQVTGRSVQRRIAELDAEIPVNDVVEADEWIVRQLAYPRFRSAVFGIFAALALGLAAIGLYGQLCQFVAERNREFAVRMAVGATPRDVMWLVARHGGIPVVAGLAIGIVCHEWPGGFSPSFCTTFRPPTRV
jgi:putative ABC transport system permease protein